MTTPADHAADPPVTAGADASADGEVRLREIAIPLHDLLGFEFDRPEPGSGRADVRLPIRAGALGPTGSLHGGAVATVVDFACALAAVSTGFDAAAESLITSDMHVRYLGRPRTDAVVARATVVRRGSQLIVVECRVSDTDDHVVAVADCSMMRVPRRMPIPPA